MIAALPYIAPDAVDLVGPLKIQPFGICVVIGMVVGFWYSERKASQRGIDYDTVRSLAGWLLIPGWIGAHVFNVLFYNFDGLLDDPLLLFKFWKGISSYGGMLGALFGFLYFCHSRKMSMLRVADIPAYGLLVAWGFGRLGCALVHDHPGGLTDFFLAIDYPADNLTLASLGLPGGPRHDLGFYEMLYLFAAFGVFVLLTRKPRPDGFAIGLVALLYAPVRFFLEFLRLEGTDPRYAGLTFAQWMSIILAIAGIAIMATAYRQARARAEAFEAEVQDAPSKKAQAQKPPAKKTAARRKKKKKR